MDSKGPARLQVLAAALLFSTGGAAVKATSFDGWQVAGLRSAFGGVALALLIPAARRHWTWRTWLVGCAYAATLLLYVQSNKLTTSANAIFLQSTAPLYLLALSPFLLRERIRPREIAFMVALAIGLALFFVGLEPPQRTAPNPGLGNLLAAASGLTWGLTIAGLRWLARTEGASGGAAAGAAVAGNLLVCLVCLPFALPLTGHGASDWVWAGYLGVFQIALAYVFMTRGMRQVGALEASLLLLLEPVINPLWTWLLHGETPALWSRVGGAIVLVATVVNALTAERRAP